MKSFEEFLKNIDRDIDGFKAELEKEIPSNKETVDHPEHYNRPDAMECIDEMEMIFGWEDVYTFCVLNAFKYRYRAGSKGNLKEDLEKADWYMNHARELKMTGGIEAWKL